MRSRMTLSLLAAFTLSLGAGPLLDDPLFGDQARVEASATLAELSAGTHLFGPEFSAEDMLGKVVVVNIGGA